VRKKILELPIVFPQAPIVSEYCKTLISKMLEKDPFFRILVREIVDSKWIKEGPFEMIEVIEEYLEENDTVVFDSI
jgi:hypothetical protein